MSLSGTGSAMAFGKARIANPAVLFWAAGLFAAVLFAGFRSSTLTGSDVAWLISGAEWLLEGRRMSVDFMEVNPPGAVLIYMPAVLFGRLLHVSSDVALDMSVFALVGAVSWFAASRFAAVSREPLTRAALLFLMSLVLLIYPGSDFGQREHLGVLFLMPWLTLMASARLPASRVAQVMAGLGMGLAAVVKPHFILIPLAVQAFDLVTTRNWRRLFSLANLTGAGVAVIYVLSIIIFFPAFFTHVLPHANAIYLPGRVPLYNLLMTREAGLLFMCVLIAISLRKTKGPLAVAGDVFLAAALAGFLFYLLQGKGFRYHFLPGLMLVFIALGLRLSDLHDRLHPLVVSIAAACLAALCAMQVFDAEDARLTQRSRDLAAAVARLDPAPRLLMVSGDIQVGFPLVRLTRGTWVQRQPFLWLAASAIRLRMLTPPAQRQPELYARYEAMERRILVEDIMKGQPGIILAETNPARDWLGWAMADAQFARLFARYEFVAKVEHIAIYRRKAL